MTTRYIVIIGDDEEPAFVSQELQEGILTVLITARNWNEAEQLHNQRAVTA